MLTRTLQTCWVSHPFSLRIWHVSYIFVTADYIHRLDPIKYSNLHNLDKDPFLEISSGMPYFNPLFACLWYNGFIKTVHMYQLLVPGPAETLDMIFARKIPNADGTQSENFVINENLLSLFHFMRSVPLMHLRQ
jgi:hypothetical protein